MPPNYNKALEWEGDVEKEIFCDRVILSFTNHVAEVTLKRPREHNGLDWAMIDGLLAAQQRLTELGGLRAVVLAGEGKSFCAGLDMVAIMTQPQRLPSLLAADERGINPVQHLALEARLQGGLLGGEEQVEAVTARMGGREPHFP